MFNGCILHLLLFFCIQPKQSFNFQGQGGQQQQAAGQQGRQVIAAQLQAHMFGNGTQVQSSPITSYAGKPARF